MLTSDTGYVPTEIINDIATDFDALLNATDAGKHLGVERFMLTKLTKPKLVEKYFDEKNASPMYNPRDLDGFFGKLRARVERTKAEDLLDIATASHRVRIPTERVVEIILRNRLPLHAVDPATTRFPDFHVSLAVLREVIATDHHGTVRPTRAAKILGINIRTIRSLMDMGVLKSCDIEELKSGRMRRYVCAKSMERFSKSHISVVELATKSGRLPGVEAVIQLDRGAQPLSLGPRANMFFRRSSRAVAQGLGHSFGSVAVKPSLPSAETAASGGKIVPPPWPATTFWRHPGASAGRSGKGGPAIMSAAGSRPG